MNVGLLLKKSKFRFAFLSWFSMPPGLTLLFALPQRHLSKRCKNRCVDEVPKPTYGPPNWDRDSCRPPTWAEIERSLLCDVRPRNNDASLSVVDLCDTSHKQISKKIRDQSALRFPRNCSFWSYRVCPKRPPLTSAIASKTVTSLNKESRLLIFHIPQAILVFGDNELKCSKCCDRKAKKIAPRTPKCCNR